MRERLDVAINGLFDVMKKEAITDGEVNYVITRIIDRMYDNNNYRGYNSAMGVLDCVAREFYRRRVIPFEERKLKENGDVYV